MVYDIFLGREISIEMDHLAGAGCVLGVLGERGGWTGSETTGATSKRVLRGVEVVFNDEQRGRGRLGAFKKRSWAASTARRTRATGCRSLKYMATLEEIIA